MDTLIYFRTWALTTSELIPKCPLAGLTKLHLDTVA
jgi:hypothetical protein